MEKYLKNKVTLVTGSAQGLGAHLALNLAKKGCIVIVHYNTNEKSAHAILKRIKRFSPKSSLVQGDLTVESDVNIIFKQINNKYKKIHILINNIGNFIYKTIDNTSPSDFKNVIESNLYSMFFCSKKALLIMKKQKIGDIINIGCANCDQLTPQKHTTPYYLSKTGVYMLTKALAAKYAKYNININIISPGILESSVIKIKTPTDNYIKYKDIENAVNFLLQPQSRAINGANLEISAGWQPL